MKKNNALMLILFLALLFWWGKNTPTAFLSLFTTSLSLNTKKTALFLSAMGICRVIIQPILGWMITQVTKSFAIRLSFLFLAFCNLGLLCFQSYWLLLACRASEAIGIALFIITIRLIINTNKQSKILTLNHYYAGIKNLGSFAAPLLAGYFIQLSNTRVIFLIAFCIFITASAVCFITPIDFANNKEISHSTKDKEKTLTPTLLFFLSAHSLEFIALGLWLSSWSLYAIHSLSFTTGEIGLSYATLALSGIAIAPCLNTRIFSHITTESKLLLGLTLLFIQPLCTALAGNYPYILWSSFILGGAGATIYFSHFHSFMASIFSQRKTTVFYGLLGSFTFIGLSIGQGAAPLLWGHHSSYKIPIIADAAILLITILIYATYFLKRKKYG